MSLVVDLGMGMRRKGRFRCGIGQKTGRIPPEAVSIDRGWLSGYDTGLDSATGPPGPDSLPSHWPMVLESTIGSVSGVSRHDRGTAK